MEETKNMYGEYVESINEIFDTEPFYQDFVERLEENKNSFYMYKKKVEKEVDLGWIEAIEDSVIAIDTAIRNPRKYMEVREELLPMELSRNITPDSVKHLAQHTNLINSIDEDGTIIPSKIMNYVNEESIQTYENKFVNTLIDRLYNFIEIRYKKICDTSNDENIGVVQFDTKLPGQLDGEYVSIKTIIEAHQKSLSDTGEEKVDVVERVEKLRNIILDFKLSPFVKSMGESYVRPPIMRTNAILKDPTYKQCLICWQFIQSYDKVGYEVKVSEETRKPEQDYINEIYRLSAMNYGVFKHFMNETLDKELVLKERKNKRKITPKFIKKMVSSMVSNYDVNQTEFQQIMNSTFAEAPSMGNPEMFLDVQDALERAMTIEQHYHDLEYEYITKRIMEREEKHRQEKEAEKQRQLERIMKEARARQEMEEEEKRQKEAAAAEEERRQREEEEEQERRRLAAIREQERLEREAKEREEQIIEDRRATANSSISFAAQRRRGGKRTRR